MQCLALGLAFYSCDDDRKGPAAEFRGDFWGLRRPGVGDRGRIGWVEALWWRAILEFLGESGQHPL